MARRRLVFGRTNTSARGGFRRGFLHEGRTRFRPRLAPGAVDKRLRVGFYFDSPRLRVDQGEEGVLDGNHAHCGRGDKFLLLEPDTLHAVHE